MKGMAALVFLTIFLSSTNLFSETTTFSVMAYNLENLFDIKHDAGKEDWTYLPLSFKNSSAAVKKYCSSLSGYYKTECQKLDWSNTILQKKIKNMAKVIQSYNDGKGPDIVVVSEVENIAVLKQLNKIGELGYQTVALIEGPDLRGIDVGVLSRFPLASSKLHPVKLNGDKDTRGILEAKFVINGKKLSVFGCHFPSQGNSDDARIIAANTLIKVSTTLPSDTAVIALGDFNTLPTDSPNAISDVIENYFFDAEAKGRELGTVTGEGSHYYQGEWSSLDHIFVLKNSKKKVRASIANWESFNFFPTSFSTNADGTPIRFNTKTGTGFSDHLPIAMQFSM